MARTFCGLWSLLLVGAAALTQALGADLSKGTYSRSEAFVIEVTNAAEIPTEVSHLLNEERCRVVARPSLLVIAKAKNLMPIFALANCRAGATISPFIAIFRRGFREPHVIHLSHMAPRQGFTTTHTLGLVAWDSQSEELTVTATSDLCPSGATRHVYAFEPGGRDDTPFVLERIDVTTNNDQGCGADDRQWQVLWSAPEWPTLPR